MGQRKFFRSTDTIRQTRIDIAQKIIQKYNQERINTRELSNLIRTLIVESGYIPDYTIICSEHNTRYRVHFANPRLMRIVELIKINPTLPEESKRLRDLRYKRLRKLGWRIERVYY